MKRLKKNPKICDYVVERVGHSSKGYRHFMTRAEAREWAKACLSSSAERVRIFHAKFTLVSDSKRKSKKGKRK